MNRKAEKFLAGDIKMQFDDKSENPVVLQSDRESLAQFITSLLKQPRRVEELIKGKKFVIELQWIINLIDICEQRLQQNPHNLVSFQCIVDFSDGHRDTIFDVSSMKAFYSNRQFMTTGFDLSFSYLVNFANSVEPERQDIRLRAISSFSNQRILEKDDPSILLTISFSNFTWGEDMCRHLSAHIATVSKSSKMIKTLLFIGENKNTVSISFLILCMVCSIYFGSALMDNSVDLNVALKLSISNYSDIGAKINALLANEISRSHVPRLLVWSPLIFILPLYLPEALGFLVRSLTKSFVVLNDYSKTEYEKDADRSARLKWILIGASITVPLGVLAAILRSVL